MCGHAGFGSQPKHDLLKTNSLFPSSSALTHCPSPPSPSVSSVWLEDKMPKRGYRIRTQFQSFNSKKAIELSKWTPNLLVVLRGSLTRRCLLSQHLTAFPSPRSSEKKCHQSKNYQVIYYFFKKEIFNFSHSNHQLKSLNLTVSDHNHNSDVQLHTHTNTGTHARTHPAP